MKPEITCDAIRPELSAYIDGESTDTMRRQIEEHLATCQSCRNEEASLRAVRKLVRIQPVEDIPDLAPAIMARIEGRSRRVLDPWQERFRIAAVAAAAAALIVIGASLPFGPETPDVAAASEITQGVRTAARNLKAYSATFSVVERGWHPEVPLRRMTATIDFRAPEDLRLEIDDHTPYPTTQWPANDVTLVATSNRWWIEEPSSCPAVALPDCAAPTTWAGVVERRVVVNRQPFDGTSSLPTDIVLPLETLAAEEGFDVLGTTRVAGRDAYRLGLDYREAVPLIGSLQAGGAWREFHPLDPVELWIDSQTWFPLQFQVHTGTSPDRELWASRRELYDPPGQVLLGVRVTDFSEPTSFLADTFHVPASGLRRDGGFESHGELGFTIRPTFVADLTPYRSGFTIDGSKILTFSDGMSYLKVIGGEGGLSSAAVQAAEEIMLPDGGHVYYLPATTTLGRSVELASHGRSIQLQTNLSRDALLRVASSLDLDGERAPKVIEKSSGVTIQRVRPERAFAKLRFTNEPSFLPEGYRAATASLARTRDGVRIVTVYFRRAEGEFDGLGLRVVQSKPVSFLPPSSEEFVEVQVGELRGRWSPERGELEWMDGTVYRAVSVPSADLYTALQIAEGLL
jgi:outer membrane lipoprotein-sorting protein